MSQENKDLKKETNKSKSKKVVENAQKSLIDNAETNPNKKSKLETEKDIVGMTSYQEQALQGVTKSKRNKKALIIILILVGLLIVVGIGIALFFILRPEEEPPKAVVCKVEVISYSVNVLTDPEKYIVIGAGDEFNFNEGTKETSHFAKDLNATITDIYDVALVYLVNNVTTNDYTYSIDFSDMIIQNCNVVVRINNGEEYVINDSRKIVTISKDGDVVLEVRISVLDKSRPDVEEFTKCEGEINLTLSVA